MFFVERLPTDRISIISFTKEFQLLYHLEINFRSIRAPAEGIKHSELNESISNALFKTIS
jgi:hypothetical protein